MKKILFLMLIMGAFSPLINAYEYIIYSNDNAVGSNAKYVIYYDENKLKIKRITGDGTVYNDYQGYFYNNLNSIKNNFGNGYILKNTFDSYFKRDLNFLNDLYTTSSYIRNGFLNYLYNDSIFNQQNNLYYENYELLYNDKGQVIESIVDGVWAGLYDDSQKSKSGALYNKNGSMVYYNGKELTPAISFLVWLQKFTNKVVIETFEEIQRSLISGIIAAVVLVLAIVRLVLELLPSSITPRRRRYYGGGRGSLSDYGDGSQVAASVRARLAAKNRALKARAYDRSGVEESTVNGILFDLENDR